MHARGERSVQAEEVRIDHASWRDVSGVHQLSRACFGSDAWPWLDVLAALTAPGTIKRVARVGDELVGYVLADRRGGNIGWISSIAVHPDHRRRGLASKLLLEAEAGLSTERIRLTLRRSNTGALGLYRKHGYVEAEVWPKYYRDGEDGLVMERKIVNQSRRDKPHSLW